MNNVITIDGGAQVYKKTVAAKLLERFPGWSMLQSGLIYQALTHLCLKANIDVRDVVRVKNLVESIVPSIGIRDGLITIDDIPLVADMRSQQIADNVSIVAQYGFLRDAVLPIQQAQARTGRIIAEGRDMGTRVFPNAPFKFFLTADIRIRARRELSQRSKNGEVTTYDIVLENLTMRDHIDSTRHESPLQPATDAIIIDTTAMTSDQVCNMIAAHVFRKSLVPLVT